MTSSGPQGPLSSSFSHWRVAARLASGSSGGSSLGDIIQRDARRDETTTAAGHWAPRDREGSADEAVWRVAETREVVAGAWSFGMGAGWQEGVDCTGAGDCERPTVPRGQGHPEFIRPPLVVAIGTLWGHDRLLPMSVDSSRLTLVVPRQSTLARQAAGHSWSLVELVASALTRHGAS